MKVNISIINDYTVNIEGKYKNKKFKLRAAFHFCVPST